MDNDKMIGTAVLIGAGAYLLSVNSKKEVYYDTVEFGRVSASQLKSMGYVQYGGHWIHKDKINAAAATLGAPVGTEIDITTPIGWDILSMLLGTSSTLITTFTSSTEARKKDLIAQIQAKYMVAASSSYNAAFPYTLTQLGTMKVKDLETILSSGNAISGIQKERNLFSGAKCRDGAYSTSTGKGTCTNHNGVRAWLR